MNFLNNIKDSFYNPAFYSSLKEQRLGISFKYFFSLIAVLSVIIAFIFGVKLAPIFSAKNLRALVDFYPKELAIQIKSGVISTNVTEPYLIKDSVGFSADSNDSKNEYENLIAIDTKTDFSVEEFSKYSTRLLIGKNFFAISKHPGQFEFNDVSKMPDFSLSQSRIFHWIDLIGRYHLGLSLLLFIFVFLSFFWFFSLILISLLVLALIILLFAKIKKASLSYKNSYQIALRATTVPLILETVFILGNVRAPIPFFYSIFILVIAFVNIKK